MPRHDYSCAKCKKTEERYVALMHLGLSQNCENCGQKLERLFPKMGATHSDEVAWVRDTTEFVKDGEPETVYNDPVTTRTELKKLLKEKGLHPVG